MDDGSRTIDCGQCFEVIVNNDGFEVRRDSGPWPVSDLFGQMKYWPEHKVWTGSAGTLDELLKQLGKQTGLSRRALLAPIFDELDEAQELDIKGYLSDEKRTVTGSKNLSGLLKRWSALLGCHRVPGIPSPEMWRHCWATYNRGSVSPQDCCYNGLELDFNQSGWTARLYSDADNLPELLCPLVWSADTFDGLFSAVDDYNIELTVYLPWTRKQLAVLLIKNDSRWSEWFSPELKKFAVERLSKAGCNEPEPKYRWNRKSKNSPASP